jgi:plastocyanin
MRYPALWLPIVLVVCSVAIAGAQSKRKPATHTVTIDGSSFQPASLTIRAGDSVLWVNKDIVSHTATAAGSTGFDSGQLETGKSWKRVFKAKGEFPYTCRFHPTMTAKLVVQ